MHSKTVSLLCAGIKMGFVHVQASACTLHVLSWLVFHTRILEDLFDDLFDGQDESDDEEGP